MRRQQSSSGDMNGGLNEHSPQYLAKESFVRGAINLLMVTLGTLPLSSILLGEAFVRVCAFRYSMEWSLSSEILSFVLALGCRRPWCFLSSRILSMAL
jgi:hypothetical protein